MNHKEGSKKCMILDALIKASRSRVERAKEKLPLAELKAKIYEGSHIQSFNNRTDFAFEMALRRKMLVENGRVDDIAFICEVKKASPSKGILSETFPYLDIAKEYEEAGADAISVLTEPDYFLGADRYLTEISSAVRIPVLRKDFIVDEYQIYEAKLIGADAVLLICSIMERKELRKYLVLCDRLGLSALVEAHTKEEVEAAVAVGARVIGVNNRNLKNFEVDLSNSIRFRSLVPEGVLFVAESGIKTPEDIAALHKAGVNGVLIGETLMANTDKGGQLKKLKVLKE